MEKPKAKSGRAVMRVLPMTSKYLKLRIAQKRTHISNEQKRLSVLISLLEEVESAEWKAAKNG